MRFAPVWCLVLCVAILLRAREASADVATITPSQDNTIYQESGLLSNGAGPDCFTGSSLGAQQRRALLKFNIASALPAGATIQSVSLTLYCSRTIAAPVQQDLFRLSAEWGEGTSVGGGMGGGQGGPATEGDATWTHRLHPATTWQTSGGDFAATSRGSAIAAEEGSLCTFESTTLMVADVQDWLDHPQTNFGWMVRGDESGTGTTKRFDTRESAQPSRHPRLDIVFTPPANVPGDFNQDGLVNAVDRDIFVAVLLELDTDPGHVAAADLNQDGQRDADDIGPFVALVGP